MKYLMLLLSIFLSVVGSEAQVIPVEVTQVSGKWTLMRGGEPYYINGAGGHVRMDVVAACGGNSIRTWGLENAQAILDEAQEKGLTVMLGMWMGHERHGFDYSDEWAVKDQLRLFKTAVQKFKNHPALLMWGVGNEMDLAYSDFNVWDAVESIVKMIHQEDPNHPTCVVTAGIDVAEVQMIMARAPSIDILGVNTYGDIVSLPREIDLYGWKGPYIVTEWGPNGHWEVEKTEWGSPVEQSSHEKAAVYQKRFKDFIASDRQQCIGSYCFLWGQKQETTATWYGMFLKNGSLTEAIDVMRYVWSGNWPENRSPQIKSLTLNAQQKGDPIKLKVGERYEIILDASDPDGDALRIEWEILPESIYTKSGGDAEQEPVAVKGRHITATGEGKYSISVPASSGPYRLFAYAYDDKGHAATINVPFLIENP